MTKHHEPTNNEIILHDALEVKPATNITIKVYLYGEESSANTYQFEA